MIKSRFLSYRNKVQRGIAFVSANNKHVNSKLNTSTTAAVGNISAD